MNQSLPSAVLPSGQSARDAGIAKADGAWVADQGAEELLKRARDTLAIEAAGLQAVAARLGEGFVRATALLLTCHGRVVVMGIGKSGHVARKIAATLSSTGTPAMFVHPAEASHGDLGMITPADVVIAISNSGEAAELTAVVPFVRRLGTPLIAMTGNADSALARHADVVIDSGVEREACPLNLAPTASTTAQMALGDALAVALLEARGFGAEDFARSHPGGALGRKLLTHVSDVMRTGAAVPRVGPDATLAELMREVSAKGVGAAAVVDLLDNRLLGIFTDGDLRRLVETGADLRQLRARDVMHAAPRSIAADSLAADAAERMEEHRITAVLVAGADGRLEGIVHVGDLLRAKVI